MLIGIKNRWAKREALSGREIGHKRIRNNSMRRDETTKIVSARNSVPLALGEVPKPPLIAAEEVELASHVPKT